MRYHTLVAHSWGPMRRIRSNIPARRKGRPTGRQPAKAFTAPIVQAPGGWKTERIMRRYAAVTDQTLRAAAEAVSGAEVPGPKATSDRASAFGHESATITPR
jgi:hypothetical protein